jgi:hypothetical protein
MYRNTAVAIITLASLFSFGQILRADSFSGKVWEQAGDTANANDFAGNTNGPSATFTTNAIDYCSQGGASFFQGGCGFGPGGNGSAYVVSDFLNNPTFSNQTAGFDPNASLANTFIQLTGTIFLNAGANDFVLTQDDGVNLSITGIGTVLDSPFQTNQVDDFTITAPSAGNYNLTLDYDENGTAPAALQWTYPSGQPVSPVPEPSTLLMVGSGLAGLGFLCRRVSQKLLLRNVGIYPHSIG